MRDKRRWLLLFAVCGNLLCWVGDLLLCVGPNVTVQTLLADPAGIGAFVLQAPLWRFTLSAICGSAAMIAVLCGFYALFCVLRRDNKITAWLVLAGGLFGCIPGAVFHVLCTTAMWFYARLGGGAAVLQAVLDYFTAHSPITAMCVVGLVTACAALFLAVVRGKTCFPRWAAVFNILLLLVAGSALGIPGSMNLGGVWMFGGLFCCLQFGSHAKTK